MTKLLFSLILSLSLNFIAHADTSTKDNLPFVGSRGFNFFGGTGTAMSITIDEDGKTLVARHGTGKSSVAYRGPFKNPIPVEGSETLLIEGNKITSYENGKPSTGCNGNGLCITDMYSIDRPTDPDVSEWIYEQHEDEMGRGTKYIALIKSKNTINLDFPYSGEQHATLVLRAKGDSPVEVMFLIEKGQFVCGIPKCQILARFDEEEPVFVDATIPNDHTSTTLFLDPAEIFKDKLLNANTVRLSSTLYQSGEKIFTFNTSNLNWSKFKNITEVTEAPPQKNDNIQPKIVADVPRDMTKPSWCKKAKSKAELLVCNTPELAKSGAELDLRWDVFKDLHIEEFIKNKRQQLRDWNKNDFQTCKDVSCLTKAYEKAFADILPN